MTTKIYSINDIKKILNDVLQNTDVEKAILNQLEEFDLAEIKISPFNTYTEENYASHAAAYYGNKSKLGQNIVGFYYKDAN